jgi:hypothetical protein
MSKHEDSIRAGAEGLLAPGEEIAAALVVSPRGSGTSVAPGLAASEIGHRWAKKHRGAAEDAGLVVHRNCGLALTDRRVVTLDVGSSFTGGVKEVKGLLSEVPIEMVESMKSKWNVLTVGAGGGEFKLECKPPAAKAMVKAFDSVKATG